MIIFSCGTLARWSLKKAFGITCLRGKHYKEPLIERISNIKKTIKKFDVPF